MQRYDSETLQLDMDRLDGVRRNSDPRVAAGDLQIVGGGFLRDVQELDAEKGVVVDTGTGTERVGILANQCAVGLHCPISGPDGAAELGQNMVDGSV